MATLFTAAAGYIDGKLVRDVQLCVGDAGEVLAGPLAGATRVDLGRKVLLPGFVNGHSHAFQRAIRGRTEFLAPGHERDDFWSWREAMYATATALDPEQLYAVSKQAFLEMALAGVTTVGEFHYLQHHSDGTPYDDDSLLAKQVIRAARDVGLRIVLLRVGYARAGHQVDPNPRQRRFIDSDVSVYLRRADALRTAVKGDAMVSVGLAPHSVRAVPKSWLEEIVKSRAFERAPLHMHVAEQPGEIRACMAEYAMHPVQLLDSVGMLSDRFTAVHGVHLERQEVARLGATGTTICACPSTERNLGDGIVHADSLLTAGSPISLGSDSQAHIDLLGEAQQLEGHLRLARLRRNVLDPVAPRLLEALTHAGSRSLGLQPQTLGAGSSADFVAIDLDHPSLAGADAGTGDAQLLASVVMGASSAAITDVFVAGRGIVRGAQHVEAESTARAFSAVMQQLRC